MPYKFKQLKIGNVVISGEGKTLKSLSDNIFVDTGCYLTFSSPNPFTLKIRSGYAFWSGTLAYSTNLSKWRVWDGTEISSSSTGKLYLRGSGNTKIQGSFQYNKYFVFTGSNISCDGNIETLLDFPTVEKGEHPTMDAYCFECLFYNCSALISAPELPSITLTDGCYRYMFQGCTNLAKGPTILPATTLKSYCYYNMFQGCSSLTTTPILPATVMQPGCYCGMFKNCSSLTATPILPATTMASQCYLDMFENCVKLTTISNLPAKTLASECYCYMFSGCTSLTTLPKLPATTLAHSCYGSMFRYCTNIKLSTVKTGEYQTAYRVPISGTGTTASFAFDYMFTETGGTFTGNPTINTTYYTSNTLV